MAHTERLLDELGAQVLGVGDESAFLVGNVVPDIYVGYVVPDTSMLIHYRTTHLARAAYIPLPDADRFWRAFIDHKDKDRVSDVTLGAWAHLVCDRVYNQHTRAFIRKLGERPGESLRVRKQGDFARFGRTLTISRTVELTASLVAQCEAFPHYPIHEADLLATIDVMRQTVEDNRAQHLECAHYELLTPDFFAAAFAEAQEIIKRRLCERARSG